MLVDGAGLVMTTALRRIGLIGLMGLIGLIPPRAGAVNVFFHFEDGAGVSQANRSLLVFPIGAPVTNAAGIVTRDRFTRTTDTAGNVTVSNVFGWAYRSELAGTYGTTTNCICSQSPMAR